MLYCCYILYSLLLDKNYIGYTGDDIQERIRKHNTNHKGFTGKTGDWQLKYIEYFPTDIDARKRETYIKKQKSRKYIVKLITGSEHPDL